MELRDWRERRGKNGDQAALTLRVSPSWISRMEGGTRPPDTDQLRLLLNLYRVPEPDRPRLERLRASAFHERLAGGRLDQLIVTELIIWAPDVVPLPLRTELYARAIIAASRQVRRPLPSEIKREARAGAEWQARLRGEIDEADPEPDGPLELSCVLDEAVLRRRRGATSVMTAQLDLLVQLAALPGADIRVLPFDADGPALSPFTYHSYGNEDLTDVVLLEGPQGTDRITDERVVADYRYAYTELAAYAATPDVSAAMIKQAADSWA